MSSASEEVADLDATGAEAPVLDIPVLGTPDDPEAEEHPSLRRRIGNVAAASAAALIFGELVSFGQTIALARLLTPAEVGAFVAGTILATFVGTIVEGGLRAGLVQRDREVADTAETVFWATLIAGLTMSLLVLAASPVIGLVFNSREIGLIAAASSGVILLFSVTNVPESMLQRAFSVRRRLIVGPSVAVTYASVAITLAALGWGVWSMVVGLYASYVVTVLLVWWITDWRPGRGRPSLRLWRELAGYGLPLVLGAIADRIRTVIEVLAVGRGLGQAALGFFRYGQRISMIPGQIIIDVGAVALFPAFARIAGNPQRLKFAYLRALRWATIGAAALSGMMIALGEPAVVFLFGDKWREAGVVVMAMAGLGLGRALGSVSEEVIKGHGRTRLLNWYTAIEITLGIGLLLALIGPFGLFGVGLAISITAVVVGSTGVLLAKGVVGFTIREASGAVIPQLICAAAATWACWAVEHLVLHSESHGVGVALLCLVADVAVFLTVYVAALAVLYPGVVTSWMRRRLRTRSVR